MIHVLNGVYIYLAGPIDKAKDFGIGWRRYIQEQTRDLGINYFDPTNKPGTLVNEAHEEMAHVAEYKLNNDWDALTQKARQFRNIDLHLVSLCDAMVIYIDTEIHMLGSYEELVVARQQDKAIYAIINGGKKTASSWLFALINHNNMYDSVDELVSVFKSYNNKTQLDWVNIRKNINARISETKV